eukprot:998899-Pelagomonas_calceolata.AAC.1
MRRPRSSLSSSALVIWCMYGNPPFSAKLGAKRPGPHLHMPLLQQASKSWDIKSFLVCSGLSQGMHMSGFRAWKCSWPHLWGPAAGTAICRLQTYM